MRISDWSSDVCSSDLDDGRVLTCRFLISASGPLSPSRLPDFEGINDFEGQSFHPSDWPTDEQGQATGYDFTGKRVGVIGTGATGVQIIPIAAQTAEQLFVFQRSPNWCTPLGNTPISEEEMGHLRARALTILEYVKSTDTAFPYHRDPRKGIDVPKEERDALFESLYDQPGYGIWLRGFRDLLLNKQSNDFHAEFIDDKIRARVKNPAQREDAKPQDHTFGGQSETTEQNSIQTQKNG